MSTAVIEAPRGRLGLLRQRDFRLLWVGETTSQFGTNVSAFAVPLVALTVLHSGVLTVSALTAAAWLPWLVIGLPAGAWVDRLRRRRVMIAADLVSIAAFGSVLVAAAFGVLTAAHLVLAALAAGVASVFFVTAYRAFLPALLPPEHLLEGNAKLQGSVEAMKVAGPSAAGLIAQAVGAVGGVAVDVASFVVSAFCLARLRVAEPVPERSRRRLRQDVAEGLAVVWRDPLWRANILFGCLANLALTGYGAIQLVFLLRVVGLSPGAAGALLAVASCGGVLGAAVARRVAARFGSARAVLLGKVALAPAGLLIPLTHRGAGLAYFVVGSVLIIAGIVAGNVIWAGFVQTYYPAAMQGRISTAAQVVNLGAMPLGAILGGVLATSYGTRTALWLLMAAFAASSWILLTGPLRTMRDFPVAPADMHCSSA